MSLFFGGLFRTEAQTASGVALFWDQQVGCQDANFDAKRTIDFDDISSSDCPKACNKSTVNYQLLYMPLGAKTANKCEHFCHWNVHGSGAKR